MALSNWDTCAFDTDGNPCTGSMKGWRNGTWVEIYKNWMYVHDKKMWTNDRPYIKDTICEFTEGEIRLSDFEIYGKRGPQNAIFVYVESHKFNHKTKEYMIRRMAGIGCSGYSRHQYLGVTKTTYKAFIRWLKSLKEELVFKDEAVKWLEKVMKSKPLRYNQGDMFFTGKITPKLPATEIGKANMTILGQMLGIGVKK